MGHEMPKTEGYRNITGRKRPGLKTPERLRREFAPTARWLRLRRWDGGILPTRAVPIGVCDNLRIDRRDMRAARYDDFIEIEAPTPSPPQPPVTHVLSGAQVPQD